VLPEIEELAYKVVKAHGHLHPELAQIQQIIHTVGAELNIHMLKEENVLFPYIKQMEAVANKLPVQETIHLETVQLPINMMEMDHELAGSGLESIRLLSNNFTPPADSCASFRLLYTMLREFEEDLHLHVHLENNILFPKAIAMEKGMNGLSPDQ
jgi:regulator of cell morphogenesis and NO signaling